MEHLHLTAAGGRGCSWGWIVLVVELLENKRRREGEKREDLREQRVRSEKKRGTSGAIVKP